MYCFSLLFTFFQVPKGALATFEAAATVSASVVGKAVRADAVTAFVANIPFVDLGKLFPATLARNIDHDC